MIDVTYHRKFNRVTVTGHAESGEMGHDLVCAAVTGLVITLGANVADLSTQGAARQPIVSIKPGDAEISCQPVRKMTSVVTLVFDTIMTGFNRLSLLYPENIRVALFE